jgi:hypothetical protein
MLLLSHKPIRLSRRLSVVFLVAFGVLGVSAPVSAVAASGPQLEVSIAPAPGAFMRGDSGDGFVVSIKNVGNEPTNGPLELEFSLSPGLQFVAAPYPTDCPSRQSVAEEGTPLICSSDIWGNIGPGETLEPSGIFGPERPGINAFVQTDAPDPVSATVTVIEAGVPVASASTSVHVEDRTPFGVAGFEARTEKEGGGDFKVAGGHPFAGVTAFSLPTFPAFEPAVGVGARGVMSTTAPVAEFRDAFTDLPPGFLGNPAAAPRCVLQQLNQSFPICPPGSKIGTITLEDPSPSTYSVYNLVPEGGYPAEFGFSFIGNSVVFYPSVRPRSEGYGLTIAVPGASRFHIHAISVSLFGVPALQNGSGGPAIPFLSNPLDCQDATPTTSIAIDSWQNPARKLASGFPDLTDSLWKTATVTNPQVEGCADPALVNQWQPTITTTPMQEGGGPLVANQPTGLKVHLHFLQSNDPTDPANIAEPANFDPSIPQAPELKTATVSLPAGVALSPSAANGLGACSDQASEPEGDQVHYDDTNPVSCPESSKVGTVTATSPLLAARNAEDEITGPDPVTGDIYVLKPHPGDLPVGGEGDGTYRLLIQVENEKLGLNLKLPGIAVANKETGQLTATFTENPQLPVKDLELEFFKGQRAALSTPRTCGTFTTTTDLEAWSAPGTPDAHPESSFQLGDGSGCASSLSARPFAPKLEAGTTGSSAGSASPFVLNVSRGGSEQEFSSLDVSLPAGLTAKLAGVPYCPEAAIAQAKTKSGAAELASPSCPAASQVGTLTTTAGPGQDPYTVSGNAYLAGPYNGGSLSLVFITPAVAGPFDLGNVVVRAAVFINPQTAQVSVKSDPIPQILDGVPLGIRSIAVKVDRPGFTLNPTNCDAMSVNASIGGSSGAMATPSNGFQVGDCNTLKFAPKFSVSSNGQASKANGASLTTKISYPYAAEGATNLTKVKVELPKQLPSRLTTLQKACTAATFEANPAACPAASVIGHATVNTPLLPVPLTGPAYFVSHGGEAFPSLEVVLQGDDIKVDLVGATQIKGGITSTTFKSVPDVPFSTFELTLPQGKYSALGANLPAKAKYSFCGQKLSMPTELIAQNGAAIHQSTPIAVEGCPSTLSFTHAIKKKTLTLTIYAPAAGKITATGRGLTKAAKAAKGQEKITLTLKQKKAGKLKTTVKVAYTPSTGKDRKKQAKNAKVGFAK